MKRILVTGCNGQLGRSMQALLQSRPDVTALFTDITVEEQSERYQPLDILSDDAIEKTFASFKPDIVVNCAAYTNVERAETDAERCFLLNAEAMTMLCTAACRHGAKLVHISTDYVFDGESDAPVTEDAEPNPCNVYGQSKLCGENEVRRIMADDAVILRTAWLYSPYGGNFVKSMLRLGVERDQIGVVADQHGSPTYAPDLAKGVMAVIDAPQWHGGIFHFTNTGVTTWCDFAREIFHLGGLPVEVKALTSDQYPTAARRPKYSALDTSRFRRTFNFSIPGWRDSLKDFFLAYQSNGNN